MQVIIEQIVSQVRAFDTDISAATLRRVVTAAVEAVRTEMELRDRIDEEGSLRNYQQRNRPWER